MKGPRDTIPTVTQERDVDSSRRSSTVEIIIKGKKKKEKTQWAGEMSSNAEMGENRASGSASQTGKSIRSPGMSGRDGPRYETAAGTSVEKNTRTWCSGERRANGSSCCDGSIKMGTGAVGNKGEWAWTKRPAHFSATQYRVPEAFLARHDASNDLAHRWIWNKIGAARQADISVRSRYTRPTPDQPPLSGGGGNRPMSRGRRRGQRRERTRDDGLQRDSGISS